MRSFRKRRSDGSSSPRRSARCSSGTTSTSTPPRAVLRGAVLPAGQRHGGAALGARDLCRRLPGAAVRRAGVRPDRRSGRPQVHVPGHDHRHGLRRPSRSACCRRTARSDGPRRSMLIIAAAAPGPGARRRVRRRRDLRRRARAGRTGAATSTSWIQTTATLGFFLSLLVIGSAATEHDARTTSRTGAGGFRSWSRSSCSCSRSTSGSSSTSRRCSCG